MMHVISLNAGRVNHLPSIDLVNSVLVAWFMHAIGMCRLKSKEGASGKETLAPSTY